MKLQDAYVDALPTSRALYEPPRGPTNRGRVCPAVPVASGITNIVKNAIGALCGIVGLFGILRNLGPRWAWRELSPVQAKEAAGVFRENLLVPGWIDRGGDEIPVRGHRRLRPIAPVQEAVRALRVLHGATQRPAQVVELIQAFLIDFNLTAIEGFRFFFNTTDDRGREVQGEILLAIVRL